MATPLAILIPDDQQQLIRERILAAVRKTPDGCWEWTRSRSDRGYGKICIQRRLYKSHRVAFILFRGPIPAGLLVCHTCDNPPCCNPDHLFLGTLRDNALDMLGKNRQGGGGASVPIKNRLRGAKNLFAKLTPEQVSEIRRDYRPRRVTYRMLATRYGVCPETILNVITGKTWDV